MKSIWSSFFPPPGTRSTPAELNKELTVALSNVDIPEIRLIETRAIGAMDLGTREQKEAYRRVAMRARDALELLED